MQTTTVYVPGVRGAVERDRRAGSDARQVGEARRAVRDLIGLDVGAERRAESDPCTIATNVPSPQP